MRTVVDKDISNNAYFCHPEYLLLAMLADDRKHVRELACRRILQCRPTNLNQRGGVRIFRVPEVNFDASNYMDVINSTKVDVSEPPLVAHLSPDDLQCIVDEDLGDKFLFPRLPFHTQAVKPITEAASKVCGPEKRDGFIRTTLRSREMMPSFETKNIVRVNFTSMVRAIQIVIDLRFINFLGGPCLLCHLFYVVHGLSQVHRYFIYGQFTSCLLSPILFSSPINRSTYNTLSSFEPKFSSRYLIKKNFKCLESLKSASFNSIHGWFVRQGVGGTRFAATSPWRVLGRIKNN